MYLYPGVTNLWMAEISCKYCNGRCVKNGSIKTIQRYRCKDCRKSFQERYHYNACNVDIDVWITKLVSEGCGIRSIGRLLKICVSTLIRRILLIARRLKKPVVLSGQTYELDELCTYIQEKTNQCWITYAISRDTKEVIDFSVGNRSNATLKKVTDVLLLSGARKIYTDKLKQYTTLIPKSLHGTTLYGTNHIERMNLTLRTHLKRLNRRTICFSKSITMLVACLKIYFWS